MGLKNRHMTGTSDVNATAEFEGDGEVACGFLAGPNVEACGSQIHIEFNILLGGCVFVREKVSILMSF
ncbi:uncharacterized protein YALI1_C16809g [Yarrowia lipolytica]|uniref:Uncharacterized protein n=1 Tax=Yarrowia lipolytica TaxID=4952 RepID=A0A1D8NAQ8_YARLL|nr:hypothetical protein YALI1_C16809g [Yarrowia lipolytica]